MMGVVGLQRGELCLKLPWLNVLVCSCVYS